MLKASSCEPVQCSRRGLHVSYERVRTGHATDALEGPDTTPLENQDAELADEQKADIADADRKVERPYVIDPVSGTIRGGH